MTMLAHPMEGFVEIRSGYKKKSIYFKTSLIFVFLHFQIPPEIVSVDAALLLRFKSDDTINAKGFSAA